MKSEVFDRRKKILDYLSRGVSKTDIVRDFSIEWGVTQNAIRMDLRRINKWAPQILRIHDGDAILLQLYNNMRLIIPNAWHEYYTADNSSAKVGALRLIMAVTEKLMNMLQQMGVLSKTK